MAESQQFSLPDPKRFALDVASDLRPEDISKSKSDTPVSPLTHAFPKNVEACTSDVIPGMVGDSNSNRGNFLELMMPIGT